MNGIVLCLNEVETPQNGNVVACPYCKSLSVRRWGSGTRNVYDTKPINAVIFRFYCVDCNRTFRYYPQGVDRSQLSVRIRRLAALLWLMDVSTRDVEEIFDRLGVSINRMTVWREGQKLIEELSQHRLLSPETRYTISRSAVEVENSSNISFSICVDSSTIAMLGQLNAPNPVLAASWLQAVVADLEIEILNLSDVDFSTSQLLRVPL
jgi:transposase-like protein